MFKYNFVGNESEIIYNLIFNINIKNYFNPK